MFFLEQATDRGTINQISKPQAHGTQLQDTFTGREQGRYPAAGRGTARRDYTVKFFCFGARRTADFRVVDFSGNVRNEFFTF